MMFFTRRPRLMVLVLVVLSAAYPSKGGESCCKHKLLLAQQQAQEAFIPDPEDHPPWIDKPDDVKPADWDSDDDGEWAPAQIEDPSYIRRLIPNPNYKPPPTFTEKLSTEIWAALPWITLGIIVTGLLTCLPLVQSIPSLLISSPGNLLVAAFLGLATPLCSCGALPLCLGLAHSGVPLGQVVTFLTASQSAGLDSAAATLGLLGPTALAARLIGAVLLAITVGFAVCMVGARRNPNQSSTSSPKASTCHTPSASPTVLPQLLSICVETAVEVYPTVLTGLALSTAALHYLPSITTYTTNQRVLVLLAALPLQLCEHTSVTIAGAIQKAGGTPGLAFALLLSAPATNLPTLLMIARLGTFPVAVAAATVLLSTAIAISYLVDATQLDLLAAESVGEMAVLPDWWTKAAPFVAAAMFAAGWIQQKLGAKNNAGEGDCCSTKSKVE